ncbi:MAG: flagellar hook-basal body complex protein FliE [Deltaproteobacteria bacterium]|jgi:flagellar hook-basal body complex protein FliE|nr:flagellar hook-basal body complex protein FliE [Deltaproteobacteria bacterium]MDA8308667.1 flagellar hook-basal body complex protein FliE [Deltaproteobacteria bacterium]
MLIEPTMKNLWAGASSAATPEGQKGAGSTSFVDELQSKIGEVNSLQNQANASMQQSAAGDVNGIPETMIKLEKAQMGLLLVTKVRDNALQAYQQVMQMQF